jgi:hypothetical protein
VMPPRARSDFQADLERRHEMQSPEAYSLPAREL